jgi:hypothetical protein
MRPIPLLATAGVMLAIAPAAQATGTNPWTTAAPVAELNTTFQDGCPIEAPDGKSLYFASNRPLAAGGIVKDLDIWVAHREGVGEPWGPAENLGAPINSAADDFCPTPVRGGGLFFVSRKVTPGVTCGMGDIYYARRNPVHGWSEPRHLRCNGEGGPNSALDEQGPSYVTAGGPALYFSSGPDILVSERTRGRGFGPATPVAELNDAVANDIQPNVRKDGREVVFSSNRAGGAGAQDIWGSTRKTVNHPWSEPVNLGPAINTGAPESRPSLSWDGERLHFGRGAPADIHVASRSH